LISTMTSSIEMQNDVKAELQQYLKDNDINTIFVSIVEKLLINKPVEPVGFIVKYLIEKFPSETKYCINSPSQPQYINAKEPSEEIEHIDEIDSDSDNSDSDNSVIDDARPELPIPVVNRGNRRSSVCAEKLCPNEVESTVNHVPKTEEEASRINQILQKNVLFEHLDENQLKILQHAMFHVETNLDDIIIQQGDDGDNFYIIENGTVDVYIESNEDPSKLVASYADGDSFGELAIMYNAPRAATCIAKSRVKLWALDRSSFKVIMMKTSMTKRNKYKAFLEKIPILSQLTQVELLVMVDSLTEETFEDEAVICNEGESGDRFFIVKEGTAICSKVVGDNVSKEVARLSSGSYFGEIVLITSKQRQATVKASGALSCLSLDRKTFNRVMGPLQAILKRNIEEYNKFQASNI